MVAKSIFHINSITKNEKETIRKKNKSHLSVDLYVYSNVFG